MDAEHIDSESGKPEEMTILELAKQVEDRVIDPSTLSSEKKRLCAEIFASRGYTPAMIMELLGVNYKWVYRHLKKARGQNSIIIKPGYQQNLISEVFRSWQAQYGRLIRMSFSDLSVADQLRAILAAHQIQRNGIEMLERLGYLDRAITVEDKRLVLEQEVRKKEEKVKERKSIDTPLTKITNQLSPQDRALVIQWLDHAERRVDKEFEEILNKAQALLDERNRRVACAAEEKARKEEQERQEGQLGQEGGMS